MNPPTDSDGKHFLSPDPNINHVKKRRSAYLATGSGRGLKATSPIKLAQENSRRTCSDPIPRLSARQRIFDRHLGESSKIGRISVKQKLLMGVSRSLRKAQAGRNDAFGAASLQGSLPSQTRGNLSTVAGMQKEVNNIVHMNPELESFGIPQNVERASSGLHEIVFTERSEKGRKKRGSQAGDKELTNHYIEREIHTQAATRRLQAVTRLFNSNPFQLKWFSNPRKPGMIMNVEEPLSRTSFTSRTQSELRGLRAMLEAESWQNGYRQLEIETLTFQPIPHPVKTSTKYRDVAEEYSKDFKFDDDAIDLDSGVGSITAYETDIRNEQGQPVSWIWFKMVKPLFSIKGQPPPAIRPIPESWVVFAIPTAQVDIKEKA